jgi:hypothetical protein
MRAASFGESVGQLGDGRPSRGLTSIEDGPLSPVDMSPLARRDASLDAEQRHKPLDIQPPMQSVFIDKWRRLSHGGPLLKSGGAGVFKHLKRPFGMVIVQLVDSQRDRSQKRAMQYPFNNYFQHPSKIACEKPAVVPYASANETPSPPRPESLSVTPVSARPTRSSTCSSTL